MNEIEKDIIINTNNITSLTKDVERLEDEVQKLKESIEKYYVRKEMFNVIRMIVYGMVGFILIAVLTKILGSVSIK